MDNIAIIQETIWLSFAFSPRSMLLYLWEQID